MQGLKRKLVYVTIYETVAIILTSFGFSAMSGHGMGTATALAVAASAIAVVWNVTFNSLFELWEARQPVRGRSVARRVAHAIGFEGGLIVFLVPLIAWWLGVGLWQALVMNTALMLFFLVYTFVFTWTFDRIFGLPAAVSGGRQDDQSAAEA